MTEMYWIAEVLSASLENGQLILRYVRHECNDADQPVHEMRLMNSDIPLDAVALLNANLFIETEMYCRETETERYLEIAFDYIENPDLRIDYQDCVTRLTPFTVCELTAKLKYLEKDHSERMDVYWQENKNLRRIIHRLQTELWKEIDRLTRKTEFFANTDKEERYNEQLKCYTKVYDWIEVFEKDNEA